MGYVEDVPSPPAISVSRSMSTLKVQLDRIDLSTDSRNTLAALIKLLAPHVPYSLHILGTILNTAPRSSTLQNVDPSKVTLWSTIPLHPDATGISTTNVPALFSIVIFSHLDHQFRFFCSGESSTSDDLPTEVEETHVKQVFKHLRDIASEAGPTYDSILTALRDCQPRHRTDTDPPMIVIWAIHVKWAQVLAPMSTFQHPGVRYVFPRGAFEHDGLPLAASRWTALRGGDDSEAVEVEASQIRTSDLPFVYGASSVPRSEAYILSRVPYSVCLRSRGKTGADVDEGSQPVACVLMHSDGSIGALRVDPKRQRQGLGRLVIRALTEKLDLSKDPSQGELDLISEEHRDLGGGALGWNWTDTEAQNEVGNRFFTSLGGKESRHLWTYMLVGPNQ